MLKKLKNSKIVAGIMAAVIGLSVAGTSISCEAASHHNNRPKVVHHYHHPAPKVVHHPKHNTHRTKHVVVHHENDRHSDNGDTIGALIVGGILGAIIANS